MPIYQLDLPEGTTISSSRSEIAKEIARIHCEETGAPKSFVHVRFRENKKGTQYVGGEINDQTIFLFGLIREGRSIKERQRILQRLSESISRILGKTNSEILLNIAEILPATTMEFGLVVPNPGGEAEWFEKHKGLFQGLSGTGFLAASTAQI